MIPVALVAIIGFPLYYIIWAVVFPQPYENLGLRLFGAALCIPLLLHRQLSPVLRRYLSIYWLFILLYSLPFFFTFMLLKNDVSLVWSISTMAAVVLSVLLIYDWLMLVLLITLGSGLAWACFYLTGGQLTAEAASNYLLEVPVYLFVLVSGSIFNYKSELVKQQKLEAIAATSSTIAHELRTPLLGIRSGINGLNRYLPQLLHGYELARAHNLPVEPIRTAHYRELESVLRRVEAEAQYSNVVIDMLLLNARRTHIDTSQFSRISMLECINDAIDRYPFTSDKQRSRVHSPTGQDFVFHGSAVLTMHVLFNLLKNALQSTAAAGKGSIRMQMARTKRGHYLYFRDTGQGISPGALPHIFDRFYSTKITAHSAGIGLAFCKLVMKSFNGSITCSSKLGDFTEFVLYFPELERDEQT